MTIDFSKLDNMQVSAADREQENEGRGVVDRDRQQANMLQLATNIKRDIKTFIDFYSVPFIDDSDREFLRQNLKDFQALIIQGAGYDDKTGIDLIKRDRINQLEAEIIDAAAAGKTPRQLLKRSAGVIDTIVNDDFSKRLNNAIAGSTRRTKIQADKEDLTALQREAIK